MGRTPFQRAAEWRYNLVALCRNCKGSVLAEFAAFCPIFMLLLLGGIDLSRLVILNQKLDRLATGIGDLVAQADVLTSAQMTQIFDVTTHVASPFDFTRNGKVIVTSISLVGGVARVNWQSAGGGSVAVTSRMGVGANAVATLPAGLTVSGNDTLVVSEVFFTFAPLFDIGLVGGEQLYHRSFFRPRVGSLKTLGGG